MLASQEASILPGFASCPRSLADAPLGSNVVVWEEEAFCASQGYVTRHRCDMMLYSATWTRRRKAQPSTPTTLIVPSIETQLFKRDVGGFAKDRMIGKSKDLVIYRFWPYKIPVCRHSIRSNCGIAPDVPGRGKGLNHEPQDCWVWILQTRQTDASHGKPRCQQHSCLPWLLTVACPYYSSQRCCSSRKNCGNHGR